MKLPSEYQIGDEVMYSFSAGCVSAEYPAKITSVEFKSASVTYGIESTAGALTAFADGISAKNLRRKPREFEVFAHPSFFTDLVVQPNNLLKRGERIRVREILDSES